jgi:uncharacterized membrane protein YGL010W
MMPSESTRDWIGRYAQSHQHPVNRFYHTVGIPMVAVSIPLFLVAVLIEGFWPVPALLFSVGWILQFAGHYAEGKSPELFRDWRFLFVGLRWWFAKIRGKA